MSNSPAPSNASHDSGSQDEGQNVDEAKLQSSKDKECQYCHQKFTSSSLGRHLDQFISKKKPDGIHNVDEIRKLRAGITRRTARGSRKPGAHSEHDEPSSQSHEPSPVSQQPVSVTPFVETLNRGIPGQNDLRFNRMNWQATGVITDPPTVKSGNLTTTSPSAAHALPPNNNIAGTKRSFSTYATDLNPTSSGETTRALELSLREVLDAVRSATKKASPLPTPYSFDFTAQTFPSLCLLLLPAPSTLFKPSPFAVPNSVSISAPSLEQHQALHERIPREIDKWRWDTLSHSQRNPVPGGLTIAEQAEFLTHSAQSWTNDSLAHLDMAYRNYTNQTLESRQELWNIELLRAYKGEKDKLKEANERIERITQEVNQLQQQVDYLSRCQWPREMALWPPERSGIDESLRKELRAINLLSNQDLSHNAESNLPEEAATSDPSRGDRWDFDKLVNKWKRHVREDRARRAGVQSQSQNPAGNSAMASVMGDNGDQTSRLATSPAQRKAASDSEAASGANGAGNTPMVNGESQRSSSTRPIPGTPVKISIISDVDDHMARFEPYYRQLREQERAENNY